MDAAAKKIKQLPPRTLPDRPYHLAKQLDKRYRVPPDHAHVYEERECRPLQYMTLLADADRGLLFTRPYYDMREDPPVPTAAKEVIARTEKKKLSLSDYKNKQKKASTSPTDIPTLPPKPPSTLRREIDGKPDREADRNRNREADLPRDSKLARPRDGQTDDRLLKPESKSKPELRDTPEKRKRTQDDDAARPLKKSRPELTPLDDRSRTPKDDGVRRKDATGIQSKTLPRDASRPSNGSSLLNGRAMSKSALGGQGHSDLSSLRGRAESMNGARPGASLSSKTTPSKHDGPASKSAVPPLLSPLHFPIGDVGASPKDRRRRDGLDEPPKLPAKPPKPSGGTVFVKKDDRSPLKLPPLLSPTLPSIIEEELARLKAISLKAAATSSKSSQLSDVPGVPKKPKPAGRDNDDDDDDDGSKHINSNKVRNADSADRFIVTLNCGKKNSKTLKRLLALPPPKKERPVSLEEAPANLARKRPAGGNSNTEIVHDSIAVKRPRASDMGTTAFKTPVPSTPAKQAGASMSRVASSASQSNTPGDVNGQTSGDRPPTRSEPMDPVRVRALRDRYVRNRDLASRLKHEREAMLQTKHLSEADQKLSIAMCLESALAYMVGFRLLFESRRLENKAQDPKTWESILGLLDTMRHEVSEGKHRSLDVLQLQLRCVIMEELIKCYGSLDPATHARAVIYHEHVRSSLWKSAFEAAERVTDTRMRASFGPWTSVDEAVAVGFKILRRWVAEEDVDWRASVNLSANGT